MSNQAETRANAAAHAVDYTTHLPLGLTLCHPNAKNTGCAIEFQVAPASIDKEGRVTFRIARQSAVADFSDPANPRNDAFDWQNGTTVNLSFIETAELLMVLDGQAPCLTHAGTNGLYLNGPADTVSVAFKQSKDPARPGFLLGVGRTPKADPLARSYLTFAFWPSEAFALRTALMGVMPAIAFGLAHTESARGNIIAGGVQ